MSASAHHIGPDSAPDRYRLLRSIGHGGEAVLYLAELELAGRAEPVVVKVLDSRTTITPEIFERVSRKWNEQTELLRFVSRPGVVGVREHFQGPPIHAPGESGALSGRALVLVMNHVDGLDLRDWRAERTLATPAERREVMRTLEQLADVLDWLHSGRATPSGRTVVHGDLSPGNVMVDENGQATSSTSASASSPPTTGPPRSGSLPATRRRRSSRASGPRPPTGTPWVPSPTSC
ncbi:phosphotransferase [Streptomyces sp. NPDC057854]|uniref:phosphotransferase n=1 Tax=unclassified Streptomyces TaxID=2593676 RepID=UPI00367F13CE